ncbi:hypothetical protein FVEG_09690 [Fusarium verticillioides 7600]|uniref:Uncharacterized protein n=1 Tax=Gibberella moniliformis (strain M3125 / FGSC 7600) TaxID=334819 RepID=W7MI12_GIBM7|nr:hypothetical protein FVEG_09690 [Fusarium verticillioides 7600]EWG50486.1 hypothetical protein FVEG_09690 [Fusarium verticillioides 7600]
MAVFKVHNHLRPERMLEAIRVVIPSVKKVNTARNTRSPAPQSEVAPPRVEIDQYFEPEWTGFSDHDNRQVCCLAGRDSDCNWRAPIFASQKSADELYRENGPRTAGPAQHQRLVAPHPLNGRTTSFEAPYKFRLGSDNYHNLDMTSPIVRTTQLPRDSYDVFLNARNCKKLSHNIAAEGNINPAIAGQYRIICAYELIRAMMGPESNQYARLCIVWYLMDSN